MNYAGIAQFNWQMLMSGPCLETRADIVSEFCNLSSLKISLAINDAEENPNERDRTTRNGIIEECIVDALSRKFGSLEVCYPFIAKHLFAGENITKPSHKQMFWKIFGKIALENLKNNLTNCTVCEICGAKIPAWTEHHTCLKNSNGFYECIDCGKMCERQNSRQCRCAECQSNHRMDMKHISRQKTKEERRERAEQFSTFLRSRSTKMS